MYVSPFESWWKTNYKKEIYNVFGDRDTKYVKELAENSWNAAVDYTSRNNPRRDFLDDDLK